MKKFSEKFPILKQPSQGYRYTLDSFLLARFARFHPHDLVCDLGAGVGILGFLALIRGGVQRVLGVELQEELTRYAKENAKFLRLEDRFEILVRDWKKIPRSLKGRQFDVVISNPPYRKLNSGRLPPHSAKAIAKHEIHATMADLIKSAKYLLKPTGRFYAMYPPIRCEELIQKLSSEKFKLQRFATIHPYGDRPATQIMVEAVLAPTRELVLEPPVVVYRDSDHYTPEVQAWVGKKRRV